MPHGAMWHEVRGGIREWRAGAPARSLLRVGFEIVGVDRRLEFHLENLRRARVRNRGGLES